MCSPARKFMLVLEEHHKKLAAEFQEFLAGTK